MSYEAISATLTITGSDDKQTLYKFVDGDGTALSSLSWTDTDNGYLLTGIVPEPSTYASIFGVLALVLAFYRRRK